jgi:uncharacterized protein YndB with AHSA1/START domain
MSVTHETWTLERSYPVPVEVVFAAWADPSIKVRWFVGAIGDGDLTYSGDFRVGGRESTGSPADVHPMYSYEAVYRDIIVNERIVATYEMALDGQRISVSVATAEFVVMGEGTLLRYTEQGVYLDDLDRPEWRKDGVTSQLDRLGSELLANRQMTETLSRTADEADTPSGDPGER